MFIEKNFASQMNKIKTFVSLNGYPKYIHNSIIIRLKQIEAATDWSNGKNDGQKIIFVELIR